MQPSIPEEDKKPGVFYAFTDDGLELPVIDLTHASFAFNPDPQELAALTEAYYRETRRFEKAPAFLRKLILSLAGRKSRLMKGLLAIQKTGFLDPITTYMLKLGPEHLGKGYASKTDLKIVQSLASLSVRLRLNQVAELLAGGLAPLLRQRPGSPLRLLNIGGGTCVDSWNALLILKKDPTPGLLDRPIHLLCLDLGERGFDFGVRALEALRSPGAPLADLDITFHHYSYDWRDTPTFASVLQVTHRQDVMAVSSEGALLDYGTDEEVIRNLETLAQAATPDLFFVGSVTRSHEATGPGNRSFNLKPRDPGDLKALVESAGWSVAQTLDAPLCYNVLLRR